MYKIKLLHVFFFSLFVIGMSNCTSSNFTPNFELGRYEYAGIDNKTFHFYRKEASGKYREVIPKTTGIGILRPEYFCDENLCGRSFYDCGLYSNLPKPYFEFLTNRVTVSVFFAPLAKIDTYPASFGVDGDSITISLRDGDYRALRPTGPAAYEFSLLWRISISTRARDGFNYELITKSLSDQEHLKELETISKYNVGDTIALCLLKERFVKK